MPLRIRTITVQGQAAVSIETGEAIDARELLRMLKRGHPELYREVWYEIHAANGKQFEIPESVADANNP